MYGGVLWYSQYLFVKYEQHNYVAYVLPKVQHVVCIQCTQDLYRRQRYYLLYILVTQLLSACNNIMELDDCTVNC